MTKKKTPQTIEECNAELELTQKKIRQYENRSKMLDRRLAIEKRKERNHRLCSRGGFIESIVPELITMTDEDAQTFFQLALTSETEVIPSQSTIAASRSSAGEKANMVTKYHRTP